MKILDKIILFIFSIIILAIIVIIGLINFQLFNTVEISKKVIDIISNTQLEEQRTVLYIVETIVGLLAIKGILFQSKTKKVQDGILLENNNGKLLISKTTLQNLIRDLSLNTPGVLSATPKILLNKDTELEVNIDIIVYKDTVIKDVTKQIQEEVITSIKQASDLNVSAVNVSIQNISSKTSKTNKNEEKEKEETKKEIKKEDKTIDKKEKDNKEKSKIKENK